MVFNNYAGIQHKSTQLRGVADSWGDYCTLLLSVGKWTSPCTTYGGGEVNMILLPISLILTFNLTSYKCLTSSLLLFKTYVFVVYHSYHLTCYLLHLCCCFSMLCVLKLIDWFIGLLVYWFIGLLVY